MNPNYKIFNYINDFIIHLNENNFFFNINNEFFLFYLLHLCYFSLNQENMFVSALEHEYYNQNAFYIEKKKYIYGCPQKEKKKSNTKLESQLRGAGIYSIFIYNIIINKWIL